MGPGWRRITESFRQTFVPEDKEGFQPTSNARNEAMLQECAIFSGHLVKVQKDMLAVQKQVAKQILTLRDILVVSMPRVHNYTDDSRRTLQPSSDHIEMAKQWNVDESMLEEAVRSMKSNIENDVLAPMRDWLVAYEKVQEKMKLVERIRLKLDAKRRTVGGLEGRLKVQEEKCLQRTATLRGVNGAPIDYGDVGGKLTRTLDATADKMRKKEAGAQVYESSFWDEENKTFEILKALIEDSKSLYDSAAGAMYYMRECYENAYKAFPDMEVPLPREQYALEHRPSSSTSIPAHMAGSDAGMPQPAGRLPIKPGSVAYPNVVQDHDPHFDQMSNHGYGAAMPQYQAEAVPSQAYGHHVMAPQQYQMASPTGRGYPAGYGNGGWSSRPTGDHGY